MKKNQDNWRSSPIRLLLIALLLLLISACAANRDRVVPGFEGAGREKSAGSIEKPATKPASQTEPGNVETASDDLKKRVCQKYDSCGCQEYGKCIADADRLNYPDEVWECMLKSSCESLCAGKPDACAGDSTGTPKAGGPETPSCPQIKCNKNSDCPGGCYGGCSDGHCLLF